MQFLKLKKQVFWVVLLFGGITPSSLWAQSNYCNVSDTFNLCEGDTAFISDTLYYTQAGTFKDTVAFGIGALNSTGFNNLNAFYCNTCSPGSAIKDQASADAAPGLIDFRYFYSSTNSSHNFISPDVLASSLYDGTAPEWDNGTNVTDFYVLTNFQYSDYQSIATSGQIQSAVMNGSLADFPNHPNGARLGDSGNNHSLSIDSVYGYETQAGAYGLIHISQKSQDSITVNIKRTNGANAGGCDTIFTTTVSYSTVNAGASIQGNQLIADEANADSYQWINCANNLPIPTGTNQSYTPSDSGNYKVAVTENNCTDTSQCLNYAVTARSGGLDQKGRRLAPGYPNPALHRFTIPLPANRSSEITIRNPQGQTVYKTNVRAGARAFQLNTSQIPKGLYFYRINDRPARKFIVR